MKQFLFRQLFRFFLGQALLSVLTFSIVIVSAGDKIKTLVGIETRWLIILCVPGGLCGVWLLGYCLDRWQMQQCVSREQNERNEMLNEVLERVKVIESKL